MNILETTIELFRSARGAVVEAMPLLHQIFTEELWKEEYASFGQFVDECGINRGQASRLVSVYQHYAIEGGVELTKLAEANPERLYTARKMKGTPAEQFEKALLLTGGELNSQASFEKTGEEHECEPICRVCHRKM